MKNKKLTLAASLMLVIAMLFSSFSVAAVDGDLSDVVPETTDITATEPTTEPTTAVDEITTTTEAEDGWYDDSAYETDEEKEAYNDGYWDGYYDGYDDAEEEYKDKDYDDGYNDGYAAGESDGYWDGYHDGYYEGYYEGVNGGQNEIITIFDRWDAFVEDLRERVEYILYEIRDFFERIFKTGAYAPIEPNEPDDMDFIPDGSQATLEGDEAAAALCNEFNMLINDFVEEVPEAVIITKTENVGVEITDCPGGDTVKNIIQPIVDNFTGEWLNPYYCDKGDSAYFVQETYLVPEYLTAAEKTVNEDGTTDYRFVIMAEAAYYDGYETNGVRLVDGEACYYTLQHELAADALYIEYADLDPATITYAEIVYPGATVTATTDAQGRLVKYDINMPVEGTGTGKISSFLTVTIGLEGYRNEGFVMEYEA